MRDASQKLHFYLNDHLGSARVVIDSTGLVKDKYWYYAFGEARNEQVSTNQSYRYTSKPLDKEGGANLYYYGARYYDPELGRFWAVDPAAGKYPGWSPYAYCLNNPMKHVDPTGKEVRITGPDAQAAAQALDQATSLNIVYDPKTGKVTATGQAATTADLMILAAINSTSVTVNLTTTTATKVTSQGGSSQNLVVGLFDGSNRDSKGHVNASQFVNLDQAKVWESVGGGTVGQSVLHETNESFIGGVLFPGQPYSSNNFNAAHNATAGIDPAQGAASYDIKGRDGKGNIIVEVKGSKGSKIIKLEK